MKPCIIDVVAGYVKSEIFDKAEVSCLFHNAEHTQEVVETVQLIAANEGLTQTQTEILVIAAWFHDTGLTVSFKDHEEISMALAANFLSAACYNAENIAAVLSCIKATKFPHNPTEPLQQILCDADMAVISKPDYWKKIIKLKSELEKCLNVTYRNDQWYFQNVHFLSGHRFFSNYGINILEKQKQDNLDHNIGMLEKEYLKTS